MKELSIEDKAKRYDEILERAKAEYAKFEGMLPGDVLEDVISELKESEDEKIRKEIINYFRCQSRDEPFRKDIHDKWITWLKKQGKTALEAIEEVKVDNANKVEPKFKVGYWLITKANNLYQVTAIIDDKYQLKYGDNYTVQKCVDVDKNARLWTIEDAKNGDVLFTSSTASHETFILKSIDEKGNAKCYFAYDSEDGFREGKYHFIGSVTNCKLATKEQRDTLFAKMEEAGYEWDAELNQLRKLDEEYNGEDYGIDSLYHAQRIIEKTLGKVDGYQSDDGILEHKCAISAVKKLYEQNPWSEEDEKLLELSVENLTELKDRFGKEYDRTGDCIDWLKSLKDRYTWKLSEEQMEQLHNVFNDFSAGWEDSVIESLYNDLKKL